jgi:hypothetical protein
MVEAPKIEETKKANDSADVLVRPFERVSTTRERVGVPACTFAIGAVALIVSPHYAAVWLLPWIGAALIFAALGTYVWLTSRSTIRVQLPPPPIPVELQGQILWMRNQVQQQTEWTRATLESLLKGRRGA